MSHPRVVLRCGSYASATRSRIMKKSKMSKDVVPEDFDLRLAAFDSVPVIEFGIAFCILAFKIKNIFFTIGAILCFIAGLAKVIWKFVVVLKKKNIWFLFIQMRILMPIGFIMMIASLIIFRIKIDFFSKPAIYFFILWATGMIMMLIFGFTLDGKQKKNNVIEEICNAISQLMFLIGVFFI